MVGFDRKKEVLIINFARILNFFLKNLEKKPTFYDIFAFHSKTGYTIFDIFTLYRKKIVYQLQKKLF